VTPIQIKPGMSQGLGLTGDYSRAGVEFHFFAQLRWGVTGLGAT
jgi:hypothetical protein